MQDCRPVNTYCVGQSLGGVMYSRCLFCRYELPSIRASHVGYRRQGRPVATRVDPAHRPPRSPILRHGSIYDVLRDKLMQQEIAVVAVRAQSSMAVTKSEKSEKHDTTRPLALSTFARWRHHSRRLFLPSNHDLALIWTEI